MYLLDNDEINCVSGEKFRSKRKFLPYASDLTKMIDHPLDNNELSCVDPNENSRPMH